MAEAQLISPQVDIDAVYANKGIPKYYANGIGIAHSLTEATIIFQMGKEPVTLISLPFPVLKSLQEAITRGIQNIETKQGSQIKTMVELQTEWNKNKNV